MRLVVLASGSGSNFQVIADAWRGGRLPQLQALSLVYDRPAAGVAQRARAAAVPAHLLVPGKGEARRDYDTRLAALVASLQADYVFLLGWMRLLSNVFLQGIGTQVFNLHPALPGTFPGTHAIARAFAAWQAGQISHTGVMVHRVVDEGVDDGPVVATKEVAIQPGDSLEALTARVQGIEHALVLEVVAGLGRPSGQAVQV